MAKGASKSAAEARECQEVAPVNTDELEHATAVADRRVLEIQAKLHRWASDDPHRRFDDLFNLVADPAFLLVAWDRVRGNKGAGTAGVDGLTAESIAVRTGAGEFLGALRSSIRDRSFRPLPVRERMIPKSGGKLRRLGIATITDRVVQASLKLVLEPIFEADFLPCSYGFRPNRRAHDAVAEEPFFTSTSYEEIAGVLSPRGLRLSADKTLIPHIDRGLDFLGWHIQRHRKRGTGRQYLYTCPWRKARRAVMAKVKGPCRRTGTGVPLDDLLIQLNRMLPGWCAYFRPGVSSATFQYLRSYVWGQVIRWLRRKHRRITWTDLRRRYCAGGWWPAGDERTLFNPGEVRTTRYRYRGAAIPSPWPAT